MRRRSRLGWRRRRQVRSKYSESLNQGLMWTGRDLFMEKVKKERGKFQQELCLYTRENYMIQNRVFLVCSCTLGTLGDSLQSSTSPQQKIFPVTDIRARESCCFVRWSKSSWCFFRWISCSLFELFFWPSHSPVMLSYIYSYRTPQLRSLPQNCASTP